MQFFWEVFIGTCEILQMASSFMDSFENEDIKNGFWICNTYGNPITLSRTAIELFSDLLKAVKVYHDQSQGHGNLLGGAFVNGGHVFLLNEVTGGGIIIGVYWFLVSKYCCIYTVFFIICRPYFEY